MNLFNGFIGEAASLPLPFRVSSLLHFDKSLGRSFDFEGCTESLFKLRQTSTLKDYILEFQRLANRTTDDGFVQLKSFFFFGGS